MIAMTNSHRDTLDLKDEVTGLTEFFDGVHVSHDYGYAKERQEFWQALQEETGFDPATTLFVDDSVPVLRSASTYGVEKLVAISRPDTSVPHRKPSEFVEVEGVRELL